LGEVGASTNTCSYFGNAYTRAAVTNADATDTYACTNGNTHANYARATDSNTHANYTRANGNTYANYACANGNTHANYARANGNTYANYARATDSNAHASYARAADTYITTKTADTYANAEATSIIT